MWNASQEIQTLCANYVQSIATAVKDHTHWERLEMCRTWWLKDATDIARAENREIKMTMSKMQRDYCCKILHFEGTGFNQTAAYLVCDEEILEPIFETAKQYKYRSAMSIMEAAEKSEGNYVLPKVYSFTDYNYM